MIEILLKSLNFSEKQIQIYLLLLKNGGLTPQEISKITKINRSTVYAVCDELQLKGVIKEDISRVSKMYIPLPPIELQKLFKKDEKELEIKKAKINSAISELEKISKDTKYIIPKINFVQEEDINSYLRRRADEWDKSILIYDKTWWGFQDSSFVEHYSDWIDWYWINSKPEIKLKLLSNEGEKESEIKNRYKQRQLKYLKKEHNFSSTIWVNGDYIIVIQTSEKPFYLFEIQERGLAKSLRYMFQKLWNER